MITVRLAGGLGNQLFQYAAGRALSLRHGVPLRLDRSFLDARIPRRNVTQRYFALDIFRFHDLSAGHFPPPCGPDWLARRWYDLRRRFQPSLPEYRLELSALSRVDLTDAPSHCYLEGYWQQGAIVEEAANLLRDELILRDPLDEHAVREAVRIRRERTVGIFVRRGDLVSNPEANAFHGVCPTDYYLHAAAEMQERHPGVSFTIFSDDLEWCRNHLGQLPSVHFVDDRSAGRQYGQHLFLLSQCAHLILSNSTFGWWAAWLRPDPKRTVIAPQQWFRDSRIDTSALIPSSWIRL